MQIKSQITSYIWSQAWHQFHVVSSQAYAAVDSEVYRTVSDGIHKQVAQQVDIQLRINIRESRHV